MHAHAGSIDSGWYDGVRDLVPYPEQSAALGPDSTAAPVDVPAFMDMVREFAQPGNVAAYPDGDAGLLAYPAELEISDSSAAPQVVYVPYEQPVVVRRYVYPAQRYAAWTPNYSTQVSVPKSGAPSPARQM